jgi:UDP-hydrolysing UDP-N-acetyl-D-glucosamine 2-epimerase
MTPPRTIAVVTVSRSDYGHLLPVLEAIRDCPGLALRLLVGGMHLAPAFGHTVRAVEADGWEIADRVDMLDADDSPAGVAAAIGRGVDGFARAYARQRPDLVVVLGDRFEMLAAAVAALPFALPVAHVHGGEVTEGAIDNQMRHAITKLAHLHFASAAPHARRIREMGEEAWRIHDVGAPGLDRLRRLEPLSRAALAADLGLDPGHRWLVVTYHPVTLEYGEAVGQVDELLAALEKVDATPVITAPNADTAGRTLLRRLEEFAARSPRARLVASLGERRYLSLLRHADAMVGNSSSGLIEAPSFELPAVNVGTRQDGRLRGDNVLDVAPDRDAIVRAVEAALAPAFRERLRGRPNPYGDGRAAERIVRVLREVPLGDRLVRKKAVDA